MIHRRSLRWLALAMLFFVTSIARADVKLASIFSDSMVLQQQLPIHVWGWADAGEEIKVSFADQTATGKAGNDGKWLVKLAATKASSKPATLTVKGKNSVEVKDILVGEVWICSGQSNMEWAVRQSMNPQEEIKSADYPQIRLFNVPGHITSPIAKEECPGSWQVCKPDTIAGFSAVGYFFGRRLHKELNVPIGLVGSNWGGTRIEPWTSPQGLRSVPQLKQIADQVEAYTAETKVGGGSPSAIYNAMIHPLAPFVMRGAIWYQGESNGNEGESYYHKKHALVNGWRKLFNPDLAFYWVQLANFKQPTDDPAGGDGWARLREAQTKALDLKHTGMAVIIDIGEANDIHPRNKQDVGGRLAQWALHQTYSMKNLVASGPLYRDFKVEENSVRLMFDNVGKGLMVGMKKGLEPTQEAADAKLARFAVAGKDKVWHWAEATIDGETVVVKSSNVANPVAVRYAYSMNPVGANLYNRDGFPAAPFRTDNW